MPRRNTDTAALRGMPLRFQAGRLIGAFQADQLGRGGRAADLQAQRNIRRSLAAGLGRMMAAVPAESESAENTGHFRLAKRAGAALNTAPI